MNFFYEKSSLEKGRNGVGRSRGNRNVSRRGSVWVKTIYVAGDPVHLTIGGVQPIRPYFVVDVRFLCLVALFDFHESGVTDSS